MKLLILDSNKISYFNLPDTNEPYFVVNYTSADNDVHEIITLYSEDNKWVIKSDYNIILSSYGEKKASISLEDYTAFSIHFEMVNKDIKLISVPSYETYQDVSLNNISKIVIGCGMACNIKLSNHGLTIMSAIIEKQEDNFVVSKSPDTSNIIYINGKAINDPTKINFGDRIFIEGLKIIWLKSYFKINNVGGDIELVGLQLTNVRKANINDYLPTSETENNLKLFDYKDIFYHTPIIKDSIEERVIKIDSPPMKSEQEGIPLILTMGSTAIIGLSTVMSIIPITSAIAAGEANLETWISLLLCVAMLVVCTVFPVLTDKWQKKINDKKEKERVKKYSEYLDAKEAEINGIVSEQGEILNTKHLTLDQVATQALNKGHFMWSREIAEDDFMQVRVGIGDRPASIKIESFEEGFSVMDDPMVDRLQSITKKEYILNNVPFTINVANNLITPFIINIPEKDEFIKSILLQLMFYYSAKDLKLVVMTNQERKNKWNDIKYSTHNWSDDKKTRFFATNESEIVQISMYLEQILQERINDQSNGGNDNQETSYPYRKYEQYYLIITDDYHLSKDASIINKVLNAEKNYGISLLVFADNLKDLPSRLKEFTLIEKGNSGIFHRKYGKLVKTKFNEEFLNTYDISKYAEVISNVPIGEAKDAEGLIPSSVSFLEMYGAGRVEHLNILSRWSINDPTISLNAPMGYQGQNKLLGLDLHERAHGPHGLIAGSTGSGKSEFIISYILSMAVNYHPYEVQFVLIDYKGGGLAGAFEKREKGIKIPHLVGTITNLDKAEMHRTLVSIKSELERRQKEFNKARDELNESTIDIYKYQRLYREGKVEKPISHLFIISDEFAELKAQQPDFMDELISTARIGRSLGVHLILATQKPSGVVNDQIWSNSRFKVCLKVQTSEDSHEVLKKPDAASIKETGRFYLQVGNDELYVSAQSAWAGEKYIPTDHLASKVNNSIDFIGNDGTVIKSVNDVVKTDTSKEQGDQLTNIVQYLYDLAVREKIEFSNLWLPNIPKEIFLTEILKKYNYQPTKNVIEAIIGEYDKPNKQLQGLLKYDLMTTNTAIIGNPGSGKENMISTIVFGTSMLHTPQEVNFYILDYGAETLSVFKNMPHVGKVITSSDVDETSSFFDFIGKELKRRKEIMSNYGGNYATYIKKVPNGLPVISIIINGFENFVESAYEYDTVVQTLMRESSKYGITFIISAVTSTGIRSSMMSMFENKALLQLTDQFDYRFILDTPTGMVPGDSFGRGLTIYEDDACEFQTALIAKMDIINDVIVDNGNRLSEAYKSKATEIKVLPKEVPFNKMLKYAKYLNAIPVGYDADTIDLTYYNFVNPNNNIIVGKSVTDDIEFLASMIDLTSSLNGLKVNVYDFASCVSVDNTVNYYNYNFAPKFNEVLNDNYDVVQVHYILGVGNTPNVLSQGEQVLFEKIINNLPNFKNQFFVFVDNYNRIQSVINYPWYNKINHNIGIWVGELISDQNIFNITEKVQTDSNMDDMIYIISNGKAELIKGVKEE